MNKIFSTLLLALLCFQLVNSCQPCAAPAPQPQPQLPLPPFGLPIPRIPGIQPLPISLPQPNLGYGFPTPQPPAPIIGNSNIYVLTLQWACRQGVLFSSCVGSVRWNGVLVQRIQPSDYDIHTLTLQLKASVGFNALQLRGQGHSDAFGLTVDNVKLVKKGTCENIVINGGFQQPYTHGGWKYISDIPGWSTVQTQIGAGKIYNCRWNSQVCELDADRNNDITQYFNFDSQYNLVKNNCASGNGCDCCC